MPAAFKVKRFITCGFAAGEVRGAHEFPEGTDFGRLVADGSIRPMGDMGVPGSNPKIDELMDQVEDLTDKLATAEAALAAGGAKADDAVAERDREIADLRAQLTEAKLRNESLENDLRAAREPKPDPEPTLSPAENTPPAGGGEATPTPPPPTSHPPAAPVTVGNRPGQGGKKKGH